jgi:four helix bundle protein
MSRNTEDRRKEAAGDQRRGERDPRTRAKTFADLLVWQKAHQLTLAVYRETETFPKSETFGLTSQLRRSTVSIAANIAEGFKRSGRTEKARFLNIAQGSLEETRYYLILANDLSYTDAKPLLATLEEAGRLLGGYLRALRTPPPSN